MKANKTLRMLTQKEQLETYLNTFIPSTDKQKAKYERTYCDYLCLKERLEKRPITHFIVKKEVDPVKPMQVKPQKRQKYHHKTVEIKHVSQNHEHTNLTDTTLKKIDAYKECLLQKNKELINYLSTFNPFHENECKKAKLKLNIYYFIQKKLKSCVPPDEIEELTLSNYNYIEDEETVFRRRKRAIALYYVLFYTKCLQIMLY